ncbi:acylphosphatase [archaeon]|jgi:acylphosphatase|nr:acylphosphatase [archaeon]
MKKSVRLYIDGTVQGVFFRAFVKQNAERLNVKGFIRNLEDGRIEVFLEGDLEPMKKMIELCKKGPKHSIIRKVEEKPERFQDLKSFKVLHI